MVCCMLIALIAAIGGACLNFMRGAPPPDALGWRRDDGSHE